MGCYIWYSEEGIGRGRRPLAVPNVTAHSSTASVPITVLLYNGPLLCGFSKGLVHLVNSPHAARQSRLKSLISYVLITTSFSFSEFFLSHQFGFHSPCGLYLHAPPVICTGSNLDVRDSITLAGDRTLRFRFVRGAEWYCYESLFVHYDTLLAPSQ